MTEPIPCDPRVRPHLVCPRCRGELTDAPGWLQCPSCGVQWPVVDGVPWLIEEEVRPLPAKSEPGLP
jgi:uncharacterized protein YbaR (Trm112 family)